MRANVQTDRETGVVVFTFFADPGDFTLDMTENENAILRMPPKAPADMLRSLAVLVTAAERKAYLDAKTARPLLVLPNGGAVTR